MRFGFTPEQVFGADFETDNDGVTAWICQFSVSDGTTEWFGRSIHEYRNILLSLVVEHTAIIVYFHNLKYDLQFQKGLLHQFETEGWTPKYILRQGSPVKIRMT